MIFKVAFRVTVTLIVSTILIPVAAYGATYWGGELPDISNTKTDADVTLNGDIYTFTYNIQSGSSNTGNISHITIDISKPTDGFPLDGQSLPTAYFSGKEVLNKTVPIGMFGPNGWYPGIDYKSRAAWGGSAYTPGQNFGGLQITSRGIPSIREIIIWPKLIPPREDSGITFEDIEATENKVNLVGKTIAPTAPPTEGDGIYSPFLHIEQIIGYIEESATLGWIPDATLTAALRANALLIKQAIDGYDSASAKTELTGFISLLAQSPPAARKNEAYGLLYYNAKYMLENISPETDSILRK